MAEHLIRDPKHVLCTSFSQVEIHWAELERKRNKGIKSINCNEKKNTQNSKKNGNDDDTCTYHRNYFHFMAHINKNIFKIKFHYQANTSKNRKTNNRMARTHTQQKKLLRSICLIGSKSVIVNKSEAKPQNDGFCSLITKYYFRLIGSIYRSNQQYGTCQRGWFAERFYCCVIGNWNPFFHWNVCVPRVEKIIHWEFHQIANSSALQNNILCTYKP